MNDRTRSSGIPHWVKVLLWTVVGLAVAFYAGGGIVFANMIHSDLLAPQPPTPDNGVYIAAIGPDTVTLTSVEERDDTTRPGVAGLSWDGGYGQLTHITEVDGLKVTRLFALTDGDLPPVCRGSLDQCEEVDIESWTYQQDPSDLALSSVGPLPFEEVSFPTPLGDLGAWRIDTDPGSTWAIHIHGWRSSRREALRSLPAYHQAGVTSLVIDYRNDEEAPDDPSGLYRFGRTEWEDVEAAVRYALDEGAEKIVLHGYSTGAALSLAFFEKSDLASAVSAAVYDSPNADTGAALRLEASRRTIPGTPIPVPDSLIGVAMFVADVRWDVNWDEINYIDRASEIISTPTLVFHGEEDDRVPIEVARRLQNGAPDLVRLIEVEEAGHVTSWNVNPEIYETNLLEFLEETGATAHSTVVRMSMFGESKTSARTGTSVLTFSKNAMWSAAPVL